MSDQPYELAGDRVTLTHNEDGKTSTLSFSTTGTGRVCGGCTLCCKLPPIPGPPLFKPANIRCKHARTGKGCAIYAQRPTCCRVWACRWLADKETAGMPRPDRAHYVIDVIDDYIELVNESGERTKVGVIQVWCDPAFPDAHRAPELRAYMNDMGAKHRMATIIRFGSRKAITIFPPSIADDGEWHEYPDGIVVARDAEERDILEQAKRFEVGFAEAKEKAPR